MPKDLFEEHGIDLLSNMPEQSDEPGLLKQLGKGYLNYAGGAIRGIGQGIGDLGASAINWPIAGIEHLSGKHIPHVPHPHLINENPENLSESVGQTIGQVGAGFGFPGSAAVKAANYANKLYKGYRAGKELPLIGKLLAGSAGGAAEGAAGNEEDRGLGAGIGAILGGGAQGASSAYNLYKGIKSKNISKEINKVMDNLHEELGGRFNEALLGGEEAGANNFLKSQKGNIKLLKEAGEHLPKEGEKHLTYALEHYNSNPTLTNAHYAQRDINKLVKKFSNATPGSKEEAAYKEALKIKNNLLVKISNAFEKSGAGEHGKNYAQTRIDYANQLGPYLNVPEIRALRRGELRESKFADAFLGKVGVPGSQEKFIKKLGQQYPGLMQRETTKKVLGNPVAQKVIGGAALVGGGLLPYEIAKLLGLR